MNAYEVKLAHHGFFEIPAALPDGMSFRVGFNPDVKSNPGRFLLRMKKASNGAVFEHLMIWIVR